MQIEINALVKIKNLSEEDFLKRFKENGLDKQKINQEQYEELFGLWYALKNNFTTPNEYYDKGVKGTEIPVLNGEAIKII